VGGADETIFFATNLPPGLLINGTNVLAVELHQINLTSSDLSFDLELLGVGNSAPVVTITRPLPTLTLAAQESVAIDALALDSDGFIRQVEFLVNGTKVGEDATTPFSLLWTNVRAGDYALTAVATDDAGGTATSAPVNVRLRELLVAAGAVWTYLDNGTDQGAAWRARDFNDSGWASGLAQLGFGDGDEATLVSYGTNANNKYITTYFRHAFPVMTMTNYANLALRLVRDDGAVVYLNGAEVFRSNMPTGAVSYTNFAVVAVAGSDESAFRSTNVSPSLLVNDTNVLAVEVHQANLTSTDLSFDLELSADAREPPPPDLNAARVGNQILLSWPASPAGYQMQSTLALSSVTMWSNVPAAVVNSNGLSTVSLPFSGEQAFFRLRKQ
jgi:hypothetical protein